jgi:hypothetical protein
MVAAARKVAASFVTCLDPARFFKLAEETFDPMPVLVEALAAKVQDAAVW